jgi:hypothetical protein
VGSRAAVMASEMARKLTAPEVTARANTVAAGASMANTAAGAGTGVGIAGVGTHTANGTNSVIYKNNVKTKSPRYRGLSLLHFK